MKTMALTLEPCRLEPVQVRVRGLRSRPQSSALTISSPRGLPGAPRATGAGTLM